MYLENYLLDTNMVRFVLILNAHPSSAYPQGYYGCHFSLSSILCLLINCVLNLLPYIYIYTQMSNMGLVKRAKVILPAK